MDPRRFKGLQALRHRCKSRDRPGRADEVCRKANEGAVSPRRCRLGPTIQRRRVPQRRVRIRMMRLVAEQFEPLTRAAGLVSSGHNGHATTAPVSCVGPSEDAIWERRDLVGPSRAPKRLSRTCTGDNTVACKALRRIASPQRP